MEQSSTNDKLHTKRAVLSEKQPRAGQIRTTTKPSDCYRESSPAMPHHESLKPEGNLSVRDKIAGKQPLIENKHVSSVASKAAGAEVKRDSQVSTTSTVSGKGKSKRKTHVGPWQLGRTLGKGATGRVRLAKHALTGESAAVKIVSKKSAAVVQSASMAKMDKDETERAIATGVRAIPFGIEREVVIMKLIEHPNIINLYDIWENRGELYLVLEYVQGGELFEYVSTFGALPEEEAVRLFRQIIAALSYCHRFNICHRDLKPENILIDANRNVKLADFGMAALQPANRWLNTSCGSPHYAAPEIIWGRKYRGEIADIWSVGIILFAMLNGFLPFDGGDLTNTLQLVKKGNYYLPPSLSQDASDLIQRILQKRPEDRITMDEIWDHALIKKYEKYHASLVSDGELAGPSPPLNPADYGHPLTSRKDVDPEILRNLQTLWHGDKQEELIQRLLCEEPNHEKLFYQALCRFREEQLENYPGDQLQHSASDYHHAKKSTPKVANRGGNTHGREHTRQYSQFSIVSEEGPSKRESYYKKPGTAASTATKASYDPYRSSRTPIVGAAGDQSTIVVRRSSTASKARSASNAASVRRPLAPRLQDEVPKLPSFTYEEFQQAVHQKQRSRSTATSINSLASSRRERGVGKSASYKRHVSFQHQRQPSSGNAHDHTVSDNVNLSDQSLSQAEDHRVSGTPSTPIVPSHHVARLRKPASELDIKKCRSASHYWRGDVRHVSNELGKICEEAFNRPSMSSRSEASHTQAVDSPATSVSTHKAAASMTDDKVISRPLPYTPEQNAGTDAMRELISTRRRIIETWDDADPDGLVEILANLDRRVARERDKLKSADQRSASDPTHSSSRATYGNATTRPSNVNTMDELKKRAQDAQLRAASDPVKKSKTSNQDSTIRLVSPDPESLVVLPEPLQIRKKNQVLMPLNSLRCASFESPRSNYERGGYDARFMGKTELDTIEEDPKSPKKRGTFGSATAARKWSWLGKRASELQDDLPPTPPRTSSPEKKILFDESAIMLKDGSQTSSNVSKTKTSLPDSEEMQDEVEKKKKWFQKMFRGRGKKILSSELTDHEIFQDVDDETDWNGTGTDDTKRIMTTGYPPATSVDAAAAASATRPIQINQNWLAKFFHIKPASRTICLQMGKVKARKEVVKILKEWRKYGLRDVVSEKRAGGDVIRGRVDALNYLHLKPVHFHAYCYTVLEHGRKVNLSIMKFTQEKGAASSFCKVVDTLEIVLKDKGVLVMDPARKKGIEKSLKEAGL